MIRISDSYKEGTYDAPSTEINPALKDATYCKKWAEKIYSLYVKNKTHWGSDAYSEWNILRQYSVGQQNTDKYKTFLLEDSSALTNQSVTTVNSTPLGRIAARQGWINVLFENISIAPKIMNAFHGMFDDIDFDIFVDAVDSNSRDAEDYIKYTKFIEGINEQWMLDFKQKAGIPIDEDAELPHSVEELNVMAANDGFKLNYAKAMEKVTRGCLDASKWDDVIKKKVLNDLFVFGYAATKDYWDNEDGKFKLKYIDPARLVIQYSEELDYSDYEYAGYFSAMTISQLKKKCPNIPEQKWRDLASQYTGYMNNGSTQWNDPIDNYYNKIDDRWPWDSFKVCVFEAEWMDSDIKRNLKIKSVYNRETIRELDFDEEVRPLSKKQIERGAAQTEEKIIIRRYYQCSWVVDSDIVFDNGPINMAPRPTLSKPIGTYHVEQLPQMGIIRQLRPFLDQLQITWLKYQNSVAMMIEKGYAVNVGMLMNIPDGKGKKWDFLELFKMMKQTGFLPYMVSLTGNYQGGSPTPITEIGGGLGTRIEETMQSFQMLFSIIENFTGLNAVALGSNPDPNAAVGTTQMALNATNNTLKPTVNALFEIKRHAAESLMMRTQIGIRANEQVRKVQAGIIGEADVELLRLAEKNGAQYGLVVKQRPASEFKQELYKWVEVALATGRDGNAGIKLPEAMLLKEKLFRGENLTSIRQELAYSIKKEEKRIYNEQMAKINQQNQGLAQIEQQKQQNEAGKMQMDLQGQIQLKEMDKEIARMTNNAKFVETILKEAEIDGQEAASK